MVEPMSIALGFVATVILLTALYGVYAYGAKGATQPDYIVDMQEVQNYSMYTQTQEALERDVETKR